MCRCCLCTLFVLLFLWVLADAECHQSINVRFLDPELASASCSGTPRPENHHALSRPVPDAKLAHSFIKSKDSAPPCDLPRRADKDPS